MKIISIKAENYGTYRNLDLSFDINETSNRSIILIGGCNSCGKTTLFDAIHGALYGLNLRNASDFEHVFNWGVMVENGLRNQHIVLEIKFSGYMGGAEQIFILRRTYMLDEGVRESVYLDISGSTYTYGTHTPAAEKKIYEETVDKVIAANLPRNLSQYFLFDAMKTSELVQEEKISSLITTNINSVMGFNKYEQLRKAAQTIYEEMKAQKIIDEQRRQEFKRLTNLHAEKEDELKLAQQNLQEALEYAADRKEEYQILMRGKTDDDVTRTTIASLEQTISQLKKAEADYIAQADKLSKDFEAQVIYPQLVDKIKGEIELIISHKQQLKDQRDDIITEAKAERIVGEIVDILIKQGSINSIDKNALVQQFIKIQKAKSVDADKYNYLNIYDVDTLADLIHSIQYNSFNDLAKKRDMLNEELKELPKQKEKLDKFRRTINSKDYSLIEAYDKNNQCIVQLRQQINQLKEDIKKIDEELQEYDFDQPQIPDPKYDMVQKLPQLFSKISAKLLQEKKARIEQRMKDLLNGLLDEYAGVIDRVELATTSSDDISFKIFHKLGNEIHLSQLNAGAKQTLMQVLLKVLYDLGDFNPPIMIDTVMGVLDRQSRKTIIEHYFPHLSHQTILLSTDTEITVENDLQLLKPYIAHTYTLLRDRETQSTIVENNYFGQKIN